MRSTKNELEDFRLSKIRTFIAHLNAGESVVPLEPSAESDEIDAIIHELNQFALAIEGEGLQVGVDDQRLIQILDTIINIAVLDFDHKAPVTGAGDVFDAVATGLNALGEELQASTVSIAFLDSIFASMVDPLIVLDARAKIQMMNPAALEMLGYHREELIGKGLGLILNDPEMQDFMLEALAKIAYVRDKETSFRTKDGAEIPISYSLSVLRNHHGSYRGAVCVGRDITEKKRINEQIAYSLREKEVLLKEIHHRVKNNLQIISSLLFLQSKQVKDPETVAILQDSQNRVRSMSLIHEKLYQTDDLGKIEIKTYIESLVQSLFASFGVSTKKITLKIQAEDVFFSVDMAIPLGVIINELVSNSLKHGFHENVSNDAYVDISIDQHPDDSWMLTVEDNGIGFPKGFDLESSKSLGLHLVRNLVDQLNGTFEFTNSTEGARLQIQYFPQRETPSPEVLDS